MVAGRDRGRDSGAAVEWLFRICHSCASSCRFFSCRRWVSSWLRRNSEEGRDHLKPRRPSRSMWLWESNLSLAERRKPCTTEVRGVSSRSARALDHTTSNDSAQFRFRSDSCAELLSLWFCSYICKMYYIYMHAE